MAAKIAASAGVDHGPSHAMSEHDEGDRLVEDEGTTSSSGSVGQQPSSIWEIEDTDAPPCMLIDLPYLTELRIALRHLIIFWLLRLQSLGPYITLTILFYPFYF